MKHRIKKLTRTPVQIAAIAIAKEATQQAQQHRIAFFLARHRESFPAMAGATPEIRAAIEANIREASDAAKR